MGSDTSSVAAATAVVGYDLFDGRISQQAGENRVLSGIGLCGSTAAGDTKVSLYLDTVKIGEYYNLTTGFPTNDHIVGIDNRIWPSGTRVHVVVDDAPTGNPINCTLVWEAI